MEPPLPTEVMVKAHIVNTAPDGDDSCPQDDHCFGHEIDYRRPGGWKSLYYAQSDQVQAWLMQRGYRQVSRSGLYPIDGRYSINRDPTEAKGRFFAGLGGWPATICMIEREKGWPVSSSLISLLLSSNV
jgi:hypothetical protein